MQCWARSLDDPPVLQAYRWLALFSALEVPETLPVGADGVEVGDGPAAVPRQTPDRADGRRQGT